MANCALYETCKRNTIGHATIIAPKFHLNTYYKRFRICKKCGEYVPSDGLCPECGNGNLDSVIQSHPLGSKTFSHSYQENNNRIINIYTHRHPK